MDNDKLVSLGISLSFINCCNFEKKDFSPKQNKIDEFMKQDCPKFFNDCRIPDKV